MKDEKMQCRIYQSMDSTENSHDYTGACKCPESCPAHKAMMIFDGKWNVQVLFVLFSFGTLRFGELQRQVDGISKTMLTSTLKKLEEFGLVQRVQYIEVPLRVEYSLTESGYALQSVFSEMAKWGSIYL